MSSRNTDDYLTLVRSHSTGLFSGAKVIITPALLERVIRQAHEAGVAHGWEAAQQARRESERPPRKNAKGGMDALRSIFGPFGPVKLP